MIVLFFAVVAGMMASPLLARIVGRLRRLPDSAGAREIDRASGISRRRKPAEAAERILDADEVREVEHKLGVGPFAGREDYCDLTKKHADGRLACDHSYHEDVDPETETGKAASRPTRFLFAENPETVVAKSYEPGQPEVAPFAVREKTMDELTVAEATKLMMAGILPPSVLMEALGDHTTTYATGVAPNRRVDPSEVLWNSEAAMRRAAELAYSGRMNEYCTAPWHDHHEIRAVNGTTIRRACGIDYY